MHVFALVLTLIHLFTRLFFFHDPATTEIYTLSLHDALPVSRSTSCPRWPGSAMSSSPATWSRDRKSTRLNSSHVSISYAVFCLKKKSSRTRDAAANHRSSTCSHGPLRSLFHCSVRPTSRMQL